jgi:hypothetical protein
LLRGSRGGFDDPSSTSLNYRGIVTSVANLIGRKQIPRFDPVARSFKDFPWVRFKDQPFSWTEGSDSDLPMISLRELFEKIVFVKLRLHIDVLLDAA